MKNFKASLLINDKEVISIDFKALNAEWAEDFAETYFYIYKQRWSGTDYVIGNEPIDEDKSFSLEIKEI